MDHETPNREAADPDDARNLFICLNGQYQGPFSKLELQSKIKRNELAADSLVWKEGWPTWQRLPDVTEIADAQEASTNEFINVSSPASQSMRANGNLDQIKGANPTTFHLILKYGTICFCVLSGLIVFLVLVGVVMDKQAPPGAQQRAEADQPPPPRPLSPEQIAARLSESTVRINASFVVKGIIQDDTYSWLGSGVIYAKHDGYYWILSNAHVVGTDSILDSKMFIDPVVLRYAMEVVMPDHKKTGPTSIFINRYLKDFAVIAVRASAGDYAVLPLNPPQLTQGTRVYAMGHPLGLENSFSSGVVSSIRSLRTKLNQPYQVIQTDATINHGNSGGPLVDEFANLVGINTFAVGRDDNAQNLNFAVSAVEIMNSTKNGEMIEFPMEPSQIGPFVQAINRKDGAR